MTQDIKQQKNAWDSEPNEHDFEHGGLKCAMRRSPHGNWCGYVAITKEHPWFEKSYTDSVAVPDSIKNREINIDKIGAINLFCADINDDDNLLDVALAIDVHGGLTYSDDHCPRNDPDGLWWFGFDCSHSGDYSPNFSSLGLTYGVYRDFDYVVGECKSLAEQLSAFGGQS